MAWPHQIEYDLEAYTKYTIGDWFSGKLSSRKFLLVLEGIINSHELSWLRHTVKMDAARAEAEQEARKAAEVKAVNRAQMHGQPLRMSDLGDRSHVE